MEEGGLTDLPDDVLYELVECEGDVGVDAKQLPQRVLVRTGLQVTVQHVAHHVEEVRVVVLRLHLTWWTHAELTATRHTGRRAHTTYRGGGGGSVASRQAFTVLRGFMDGFDLSILQVTIYKI